MTWGGQSCLRAGVQAGLSLLETFSNLISLLISRLAGKYCPPHARVYTPHPLESNQHMAQTNNHSLTAMLVLGVFLAATLLADPTIADKVQKMKSGKRMELVLNSGDKLMGNRGAVFADHFVLEPDSHKQSSRPLNYSEIRTVKTKWTRATKWIIGVGIWGVVTLLGSRV